ncbi:MAG: hypothetical protein OXH03_00965 [Bacteroidetes bacterium]|nr:hypothetical protein [Bacteroidota bacterium]MDE2672734.1 hypothetical protein [Bacteroidota bacterium]
MRYSSGGGEQGVTAQVIMPSIIIAAQLVRNGSRWVAASYVMHIPHIVTPFNSQQFSGTPSSLRQMLISQGSGTAFASRGLITGATAMPAKYVPVRSIPKTIARVR